MFVDIVQHSKTKQEFICCIDNAKVHLKAVLQLGSKKNAYIWVKLRPCIFLKLFLNFSDFEPRYSFKIYPYEKRVYLCLLDLKLLELLVDLLWFFLHVFVRQHASLPECSLDRSSSIYVNLACIISTDPD